MSAAPRARNRWVLFVLPRVQRDGGIAAHVLASAQALAADGARVTILAGEIADASAPPGIELAHSAALLDARVSARERLGPALACEPTVIHLHQLEDPVLVGELRRRAPVVVSAHAYPACTSAYHYFRPGEECTRAHGPGCVPRLLRCGHTRDPRYLPASYRRAGAALAALRGADLAVCYSSAVERHLAANDVRRTRVVPLFPTVAPASPGASAQPSERRVLFAGRAVAAKGLGVLVRAMRELDAELTVCGDGWQLPAIRRLVARLRLQERVRFEGWLGADALAAQLARAALVAIPSLWPEPFGLVGIEALASARPVVASATGGIGDWLEEGVCGLTVPAGEVGSLARALGELLDDPARRERMGLAGRAAVAERFSRDRHLAAIDDAYAQAGRNWLQARGGAQAPLTQAASAAPA